MLEGRTRDELRAIAMAGGGLEINGGTYITDDLRAIAMAMREGTHLVIHNSRTKTTDELRAIAMAGKGHVIFA